MRVLTWGVGVLGLVLMSTSLGWADPDIKILVKIGDMFYCDTQNLPDPTGPKICAHVRTEPCCLTDAGGQPLTDVRTFTVGGTRANMVGGNASMCTALSTLIVNRTLAEYQADHPGFTLIAANLAMQGCPL
jgi:hypothetical protein